MERWRTRTRRALALFLAVLMCAGMLNLTAFAGEEDVGEEPCAHQWGDWEEIDTPTCEADGEEARTCELCGEEQTRPVPGGHDWQVAEETEEGTWYGCEVCGDDKFVEKEDFSSYEENTLLDEERIGDMEDGEETAPRPRLRAAARSTGGEEDIDPLADEPQTEVGKLQTAINAAENGVETTVTMTADITDMTTAEIITIPVEKVIVLDMAGHSITVAESFSGRVIVNNGTLTVQGNGTIDASGSSDGWGAINNLGTLTIENGTFRGNSESGASNIRNYGKDAALVINDGTFDTSSTAVLNYDGLTTLNGGTYTTHDHNCSSCGNNWSYVIRTYTDGKKGVYPRLYVNGGTYTGTQGALSSSTGYIEVNGGTFKTVPCGKGHTAVFYALYAAGEYGDVQCIINGGTFETVGTVAGRPGVLIGNDNKGGDGGINADALSHIYGGTFIAPDGIPAIGVSTNTAKASVIHGGTYTLLTEDAKSYVDPAKVAMDDSGRTVVQARTENDEDAVAKVGDDVYASLPAAIDAVPEKGTATIEMVASSTLPAIIPAGKSITLNVPAGVTLSNKDGSLGGSWGNTTLQNHGTLTITGDGAILSEKANNHVFKNFEGATANLNGCTFKTTVNDYVIWNLGTMTIDGATVDNTDAGNNDNTVIYNGWRDTKELADHQTEVKSLLTIKSGIISSNTASKNAILNTMWATLVIEDGEISAPRCVGNYDIAEIKGGTFTVTGKGGRIVLAAGGSDEYSRGQLTITGGTFLEGSSTETANVIQNSTSEGENRKISISGGTFFQDVSDYVVEGSMAQETDGVWTIVPATGEGYVAIVGNTSYKTLQSAIDAAKSGDTVKLLKDVEITDDILISKKDNITLDGGNHTISVKDNAQVHGIQVWKSTGVKINNLTITGAGKDALLVNQESEVTATNLTTSGNASGAVNVDKNSTFTLVSGTLAEDNKIWTGDAASTVIVPNGWNWIELAGQSGKKFYTSALNLTLSSTSATLYTNGTNTVTLRVNGLPENAVVTWESTDNTIATVSADGVVRAVAQGGANIIAKIGGFSLNCAITVTRRSTSSGGGGGSYRPSSRPSNGGTVNIEDPDVPLAQAFPFTDVAESSWYFENVKYVHEKGMMNGISGTIFAPNNTTTRGMIVTILYRLEGSPAVETPASFTDVSPDQYYADPVAWASANDIVNGYDERTFKPEIPITREQMAAILYRYAAFKGYDVTARAALDSYTDAADVSAYAAEAMQWANAAALISGSDGRLQPKGDAVRAQVAAILNRFCEQAAK